MPGAPQIKLNLILTPQRTDEGAARPQVCDEWPAAEEVKQQRRGPPRAGPRTVLILKLCSATGDGRQGTRNWGHCSCPVIGVCAGSAAKELWTGRAWRVSHP